MAKVRIKASAADVAQAAQEQGDFVLPPVGLYTLTCTSAEPGFSKGDDGEPDESRPYIEFIYTFSGKGREDGKLDANYGKLWDYMSFSESSGWKRAEVMKAYGVVPEDYNGEIDEEPDTDDFINRKVVARIKHETQGQGKNATKRAKIAKLYRVGGSLVSGASASSAAADVAFGGADDDTFGSTEEQGEDVFGGVETEEPAEAPQIDPARRKELEGMSLKELGTVAKGVDVDPSALIVKDAKGKLDSAATQEAVINAILDAEAGGDEEDPF
jgi:hypothetical protein